MRYKMEAQGTVWTKPDTNPPSAYSITDTLDVAYYPPLIQAATWNTPTNSSMFEVGGYNFAGTGNHSTSDTMDYPMDSFGFGLYRVSTLNEETYFYIDYRDNRYRNYIETTGHPQDIWIRYNAVTNLFSYRNTGPNMQNLDGVDWTDIACGDYLSIWEIKNQVIQGSPKTDSFPNYWVNSLMVFPKPGMDNILIPHLVWGPIPGFVPTGYKIFWSLRTPNSFSLLDIVSADTYQYSHEGLAALGNRTAYYKVKAYNTSTESNFSNTAQINVSGYFFKENFHSLISGNVGQFSLIQNYPNPFNPSTKIKFALPVSAVVTVRVFNAIGEEVAVLGNREYSQGIHEEVFGAESVSGSLTSGVYFYTIDARGSDGTTFRSVNKMLLLK